MGWSIGACVVCDRAGVVGMVTIGDATLHLGDCLEVLRTLPAASVHAIVTDPPAGIGFMGKEWDDFRRSRNPADTERENQFGRLSARGPEYGRGARGEFIAFMTEVAQECLRVLKPGGHALVWAIPRTSHWTAMAWEDAGFEVRDRVTHAHGQGFSKGQNVGKVLPAWTGWHSSLKPAVEDWWLCRKPLDGTVAQNVLTHGVGALNIDGCRVTDGSESGAEKPMYVANKKNAVYGDGMGGGAWENTQGRFPANLIHDGSDDVVALFPIAKAGHTPKSRGKGGIATSGHQGQASVDERHHVAGSASRFFYCAKASRSDRGEGNAHPTVKANALMRYLCRLVTPPYGIVLDPFMGSGSTGKAALLENFRFVGIEQEPEYYAVAQRRVAQAYQGQLAANQAAVDQLFGA